MPLQQRSYFQAGRDHFVNPNYLQNVDKLLSKPDERSSILYCSENGTSYIIRKLPISFDLDADPWTKPGSGQQFLEIFKRACLAARNNDLPTCQKIINNGFHAIDAVYFGPDIPKEGLYGGKSPLQLARDQGNYKITNLFQTILAN